jgi:hypothetical protein
MFIVCMWQHYAERQLSIFQALLFPFFGGEYFTSSGVQNREGNWCKYVRGIGP